ncbi:hypothetical protein [Georgenia yuyongxinii]
MKLHLALEALHADENALAQELLRVAERHKVDHDIYHLGRDLAIWSQRHVTEIATIATRFGAELDPEPDGESALPEKMREKAAELMRRRGEPALLLLRDLRRVYTGAAGVYADWELIAQAAQGLKDTELMEVAGRCGAESKRQMKWANGKLKESATQILLS